MIDNFPYFNIYGVTNAKFGDGLTKMPGVCRGGACPRPDSIRNCQNMANVNKIQLVSGVIGRGQAPPLQTPASVAQTKRFQQMLKPFSTSPS